MEFNCLNCRTKYMITLLKGAMQLDAPWRGMRNKYFQSDIMPDQKTNVTEIEIEEYLCSKKESTSKITFEEYVMRIKNEYESFLKRLPEVPERYRDLARYAAYVNWSNIVSAEGHLTRSAMYMSKSWMNRGWCWDHCFNAIALSYNNPETAWDQLMIMFDLQYESGCLPDCVNDQLIVWNFCKPPIHGWTLKKMMKNNDWFGIKQLNEIYHPLCKWTQRWFDYMDDDKDGIPQYNHGNDSGYDNSTVFDQGIPLETPELLAFLVIQMEVISELAKIIGKPEESIIWEKRANELFKKLIFHFAIKSEFKAVISGSHLIVETCSINTLLTIILGKRLPKSMLSVIIHKIKEQSVYMTKYGLATESTNSVKYESDEYWRGSIWAPIILLIKDGLSEVGEQELSKIISKKFIKMVAKSGFAECFMRSQVKVLEICLIPRLQVSF